MFKNRIWQLTGNTPITAITSDPSQTGDTLMLIAGAVGQQIIAGNNIQIAQNWTAQEVGDSILLTCYDGVNWTELGRKYPLAYTDRRKIALRPTAVIWENRPREENSVQTVSGPASGTLNVFQIELPAGLPLSRIGFVSGNVAAVGPTNQWFSLYDLNRNPLCQTADDGATAWAATTAKDLAVTGGPFNTTYEGLYYVGIVVVTSTTQPNLMGNLAPAINGLNPVWAATTTNVGLTGPVSQVAAGLSGRSGSPYVYFK